MSTEHQTMDKGVCQVCQQEKKLSELLPAQMLRDSIVETIKKEVPAWSATGLICLDDLNHYRQEHLQEILEMEMGSLSDLDLEVVASVQENDLLSKNINAEFNSSLTLANGLRQNC